MVSSRRTSRRRAVALVLSGIFPVSARFYNRQPIKGVIFLGLGVILTGLMMQAVPLDPVELVERGIGRTASVAVLVLLAIWLWSVIDAWRGVDRRV